MAKLQEEYFTSANLRVIISVFCILTNGIILFTVFKRKQLRNQHNMLLVNLAAGDLLQGLSYLMYSISNLIHNLKPSRYQCLAMLVPVLWATYVSICSVIPIAYYRVKLMKAYNMDDNARITDPCHFKTSIVLLWIFSLIGSLLCFVSLELEDTEDIPACLLPLAVSKKYLVWYFLFTLTITIMVISEYLRIIVFVIYGATPLFEADFHQWHKFIRFDRNVTRIVSIMAGCFAACWIPAIIGIFYYLHPTDPPSSPIAHRYMDYVTLLPLANSGVNPIIYTLSEQQFRDNAVDALLSPCFRLRRTIMLRRKAAAQPISWTSARPGTGALDNPNRLRRPQVAPAAFQPTAASRKSVHRRSIRENRKTGGRNPNNQPMDENRMEGIVNQAYEMEKF